MKIYKPIAHKLVKRKTSPDWISHLPYIGVASNWGISVRQFSHAYSDVYGFYDSNIRTIWLYSMSPRIFLHELAHVADDRNYTLSSSAPPETFLNPEIMRNYIHDEVVAEWSATSLLQFGGLSPRSSGRGNSQIYVQELCEMGGMDWEHTIADCSPRINMVIKTIQGG